jgi:hypothetical protein
MGAVCPWLAAVGITTEQALRTAAWFGVVLAAALALGALAMWVRRWALKNKAGGGGLSIENVEALYRSGQISKEEMSALRRTALGLGSVNVKKGVSPLSPDSPDDDERKIEGAADSPRLKE